MDPEDNNFLRHFYQEVQDRPLEPDDPKYVALYERLPSELEDPVELLARSIQWSPSNSSTQLFSGFRGSGKSTELRRLSRRLADEGYLVVLFDVLDYLAQSLPIDVSDFLMVLAGGLGDSLIEQGALPQNANRDGYWTRLTQFLGTRVEFQEVVAGLGPMEIKASLSADPSFRERLQKRAEGHLAALVEDVRGYVRETVAAIPDERRREGMVLLVDSIETISGTLSNARAVQESVERLFTGHAEHLHLPDVHVVYSVPPWLRIRAPGVSARYSGGLQMLHPVKVRVQGHDRKEDPEAVAVLREVVTTRGDWRRLLGDESMLDRLVLESGGHLRDLLRLLAEIIRRADRLPVDERTVQRAMTQMRSDMLPIAEDDAAWLQRIAETREIALSDIDRLPRLVTFLDSNLVLCYRNGEEWYDVHPLIREEVAKIAAGAAARHTDTGDPEPPTEENSADEEE